jgi:hypothetical protein
MPPEPLNSIYRAYASLHATIPMDPDSGLGGKLLYAGELSGPGRELLFAANIAGAASIGASADPVAQREAIRDGVIDFLVTSLEEALRILKNEIRKHQAVSVAVSIDPNLLVEQMLDRGVLPDLLPSDSGLSGEQRASFLNHGALPIANPASTERSFVTWSAERDFPRLLPKIDALAHSVIPETDRLRSRWLRLAPRYLGRLAQRQHGVALAADELRRFQAMVKESLDQSGPENSDSHKVSIEKWNA